MARALLLTMLLGLAIAQDGPTHAFAQDGPTHTLVKPSIVCGTIELLETFAFSSRIPEGIDCQQLGVDWRGRYSGARELKLIQGGLSVAKVRLNGDTHGYVIAARLLPIFAIQPSSDGWEFAQWGMTLSELLVAAEHRKVRLQVKTRPDQCGAICLLAEVEKYQFGPFDFTISFGFDRSERLNFITLRSMQLDCFVSIEQALAASLGPTTNRQDEVIPTRTWRDGRTGNTIRTRRVGPLHHP